MAVLVILLLDGITCVTAFRDMTGHECITIISAATI